MENIGRLRDSGDRLSGIVWGEGRGVKSAVGGVGVAIEAPADSVAGRGGSAPVAGHGEAVGRQTYAGQSASALGSAQQGRETSLKLLPDLVR